jgi:regulatory protein
MPARGRAEITTFCDGVVTALVATRSQVDRVNVHIDGRFAFGLSSMVADRAGLRAGDPLDAERQRELVEQDAPYRARERALRFLGVRDRSRREVEVRLRQTGFAPGVIGETVTWLAGLGYLDDRRFSAAYAAEKRRTGWAARKIRVELAGKGIERSVIDEVLELQEEVDAAGERQGEDALQQTVRRRFASQFATDPDAAERRLAGFLARRGYDWDTIGRMARALRAEAAGAASAEPGFPSVP